MTAISQAQKESTGQVQPRRQRRELSDRAILNLFIWPTLILLIAWNLFPLIYSLFLSFTDYSAIANKAPTWVGFQNYADILSDPQMWKYFATTGRYALVTVGMQTILGFSLAVLVQEKFKGSGLVTTLILVPMMLSPVVVGMFWKLMYNPSFGYFNFLLGFRNPSTAPEMLAGRFAGQPVPNLALWAVALVDIWMWTPFVMLLVLSGLKAIPDYLYEAAVIDRASSWFQFWRITVPQVMPLLMIAILFRTIEAFKSFDLVMGLTGGGPGDQTELIAVNLYRQAFLGQWRTGRASALAYIILIVIIAISNLYIRYLNQAKED
ncbi:MAG: sugar ABC transporter permease [Caldilineae bacterium]|nr:sugar ABC transporter permease [Anaerolineae bacterium]MCB0203970.1 sugar ABC transporter permease [Anaerolineae bacterium]MCB0255353.1 sugar ABC transporter permease [Anaerolineae bacterium]MCB9154707.1 sugar ABC transporter permease [Caldilineae bacterium]